MVYAVDVYCYEYIHCYQYSDCFHFGHSSCEVIRIKIFAGDTIFAVSSTKKTAYWETVMVGTKEVVSSSL